MHAWNEITKVARRILFDEHYGSRHIHLQVLATHPAYQRLGAATALCEWGIGQALRHGVVVTLFASPMGKLLYQKLGFENVTTVPVKVQGEDASVELSAMNLVVEPAAVHRRAGSESFARATSCRFLHIVPPVSIGLR
ncbi:hypothetical protein BDY21DRAFT_347798 [Lineolata rhizophorae]|uniref:N-acetyltransferase domain-containing protein n=1 Tax=Lineolata rhizophorae TaxID=578093 RepID=A0A6A6NXS9_9PEZI|nr:hypothetical protein BDY21DRAFT_347798 [Lineolata rhizophorae]